MKDDVTRRENSKANNSRTDERQKSISAQEREYLVKVHIRELQRVDEGGEHSEVKVVLLAQPISNLVLLQSLCSEEEACYVLLKRVRNRREREREQKRSRRKKMRSWAARAAGERAEGERHRSGSESGGHVKSGGMKEMEKSKT